MIEVTAEEYVYVGENIKVLRCKEKIQRYFSPLGNNLPYPYAVGKYNTYFLWEPGAIVPNKELLGLEDPNEFWSSTRSMSKYEHPEMHVMVGQKDWVEKEWFRAGHKVEIITQK